MTLYSFFLNQITNDEDEISRVGGLCRKGSRKRIVNLDVTRHFNEFFLIIFNIQLTKNKICVQYFLKFNSHTLFKLFSSCPNNLKFRWCFHSFHWWTFRSIDSGSHPVPSHPILVASDNNTRVYSKEFMSRLNMITRVK